MHDAACHPHRVSTILENDLGPPRLCHTLDAVDAECDRQARLLASNDLRTFRGLTFAWTPATAEDGSTVWAWVDKFSTYHGRRWRSRYDRENAWTFLLPGYNGSLAP